jgi:hypothetical protein
MFARSAPFIVFKIDRNLLLIKKTGLPPPQNSTHMPELAYDECMIILICEEKSGNFRQDEQYEMDGGSRGSD